MVLNRIAGTLPAKKIPTEEEWANSDWDNQLDIEIARVLDVTGEAVRRQRAKRGKKKVTKIDIALKKLKNVDWAKESNTEISNRTGVSRSLIYTIREKFGYPECKKYVRKEKSKWPVDSFNWKLPNTYLEEIWGLPRNSAANLRSKHKVGIQGIRLHSEETNSSLFNQSVEKEKEKAASWRKN